MILQSLYDLYLRKRAQGEIAAEGYITKEISFLIRIDSGRPARWLDLREPDANSSRLVGKSYEMPSIGKQVLKHTNSGKDANLLWDNSAFVLGVGSRGELKRRSFIETIKLYFPSPPDPIQKILALLENDAEVVRIRDGMIREYGTEIADSKAAIAFRVDGRVISEQPYVEEALSKAAALQDVRGVCLVTGETDVPIVPTHNVLKGVVGAQSSGANLVSFNSPSFCSYGMEQSFNASTGAAAMNGYTKALQWLIYSEGNRVRLSDMTIVFWAERPEDAVSQELIEGLHDTCAGAKQSDNVDEGIQRVKNLLTSIHSGRYLQANGRFFVLGLAPNAARLSVRYWEQGEVRLFAERIAQHFEDHLIGSERTNDEYLSLYRLLCVTALEGKLSNVAPNMAGDVIRSVLSGTPYPRSYFAAVMRRIRVLRKVDRVRAGIVKACINRELRCRKNFDERELITVSLDKSCTNTAYLLGRLFALLEKIQGEALGDVNATIRDRFYGAASTTPMTVFPRLLKLKNHHIEKLDDGLAVVRERQLAEVIDGLTDIPSQLPLKEQGRFAIGYYHQMRALYTKKDKTTEGE